MFPSEASKKQVGLAWRRTCSLTPKFPCVSSGVHRPVARATVYLPSSCLFPPCPGPEPRAPGTYNVSPLFTSLSSPFTPPSGPGPRPCLAFPQRSPRERLAAAMPSQSCWQPFGGALRIPKAGKQRLCSPHLWSPIGKPIRTRTAGSPLNLRVRGSLTLSARGAGWLCLFSVLVRVLRADVDGCRVS